MTGLDTVSGTWESKFARLRQLALNTHTKERKFWAPYAVMSLSEPEAPKAGAPIAFALPFALSPHLCVKDRAGRITWHILAMKIAVLVGHNHSIVAERDFTWRCSILVP